MKEYLSHDTIARYDKLNAPGFGAAFNNMTTPNFDTAAYLRKATSRAKSDVANKLISMLLHEISRRVVGAVGLSVTDAIYAATVAASAK